MRIAAQYLNETGVTISKSKTYDVLNKYIKQHNVMSERLFNLGYLSSPSYFDADEFWKTFLEEHPEYVSDFCDSMNGTTILSSEHIDYVINLITDDNIKELLTFVKLATDATQAISDISSLLDLVKFKKKSDLLTVKSRFTVSNGVYNSGKVPLDSPYIFECYHIEGGYKVVSVDYSFGIYKNLLKKLEIEDVVTLKSQALFLDDKFTVEDECKYLNLLSSGEIRGSGKYADKLFSYIESYYSEYYKTSTTVAVCLKFSQQNFIDATADCISIVNDFRAGLSSDATPFYLNNSKVFFKVEGESEDKDTSNNVHYVGSFLMDSVNKAPLGVADRLMGFCGEFISVVDAVANNFKTVGSPIYMHFVDSNTGDVYEMPYYPIYNVKKQVSGRLADLYPIINVDSVSFKDFDEVLKELEITPETLVDEVAGCVEKVCETNQYLFNKLVGYLFQTLLCIMCDHTLDGYESPNQLILGDEYDWLTEEIYRDACIETESIFKKLGF